MSDFDLIMTIGCAGLVVAIVGIWGSILYCVVTKASWPTIMKLDKYVVVPSMKYGLGGSLALAGSLALMRCFL